MRVFIKRTLKNNKLYNLTFTLKKKKYLLRCLYLFRRKIGFLFVIFFIFNNLYGQIDTASLPVDSLSVDTLAQKNAQKKRLSPDALTASVKYISQDSIIINLKQKTIFLFEDAKAYYEDIELNAGFMEFGFVNSELYASGVADTCGHFHGAPVFKQGESEFSSQEIRYNFKSKKGKVTKVITSEGDGYVHGYYVKHVDDKTSYIKGGQYTTCNLEHPHFQIRFNKGKVIQDDKIVTGPAYISFGDVPTPLAIPFGYFPLQKARSSGIVIPRIGQTINRGFYFEDFGYYLGISDNFDLLFSGDITTRGNWAAKTKANYVFRYKCNGTVELTFAQNRFGEFGVTQGKDAYYHTEDYKIYWKHNQDPKSHPTTKFAADIKVVSRTYSKYNPSSTDEYLSNQFSSSLSLSTNAKGFFFFDAAARYTQNTRSREVGLSLPEVSMNIRQIYPFRKKYKSGRLKWYDNISLKWSSQMSNNINTADTLFFKPETFREMRAGMQHTIPFTLPIKLKKGFNWNTSATLTEKWYLQRNEQEFSWRVDTSETSLDTLSKIYDRFKRGFYALHDLSLSTSLSNTIYILGKSQRYRHVMKPDLSFTFRPNLNENMHGTYYNTLTGKEVEYSYFPSSVARYGAPADRMEAISRLIINNNIEIKVKSKKDTITGMKKITLFDNIAVSCAYDFAADSLNWKPLMISGRTAFFSFLNLDFNLCFEPYVINNEGKKINKTELKVNHRLLRFSNSNLNVGLNLNINQDFFKSKKKNETNNTQQKENSGISNTHPDLKNPWNITISYIFSYLTADNLEFYKYLSQKKYTNNIIQTLNIRADVNITRKWKIEVQSGYDIQHKEISFTEIKIYRDLHCWEMSFGWVPFGYRKGWNFQINVKASVLKDLKYNMKRDFRDNF